MQIYLFRSVCTSGCYSINVNYHSACVVKCLLETLSSSDHPEEADSESGSAEDGEGEKSITDDTTQKLLNIMANFLEGEVCR